MCIECGRSNPLEYKAFRTGLTFGEVRHMLWVDSDDPEDWQYKRRNTVLGLWRMLKQQMYCTYTDHWDVYHRKTKKQKRATVVPF